jgi:hypothetical protein
MTRQGMTGGTTSGHRPRMHALARWALLVGAHLVVGCGARTLPDGEGQEDAAPAEDDSASTDEGGIPFLVCPFDPPAVDSTCDTPGEICVFPTFDPCQSLACDTTGHWQPAPEGC